MNNVKTMHLRERDFYRITDKMWDDIEAWVGQAVVDLKFDWTFTPIGKFLRTTDANSGAYIEFCDEAIQKKVDIAVNAEVIKVNVLPVNDVMIDKVSFNISYYADKKNKVKELINEIKQKIRTGKFNKTGIQAIKNSLNKSPEVIDVEEQYDVDNEDTKIELRN